MSYTGLTQGTAKDKLLEANLLQYPTVFKQALYKLSWTKAPERLLSSVAKMKTAIQVSKRISASSLEEQSWAIWAKLQSEHALE